MLARKGRAAEMLVNDVMTRAVVTVSPETPLKAVARLLLDHRISGVPVVDARGTVLGVVSEADFLVKELPPERRRLLEWFTLSRGGDRVRAAKLEAVTAGEAMTSPAVTVASSRPVADAAATMTHRKVSRLPVIDDGRLVGIVTRADLVRAYIRSDAELARTIRDEVILGILWLDPAPFSVDVVDGIARIRGHVERRSTAELAERAATMVPGILRVDAAITWDLDDHRIRPAEPDPVFPFGAR
jgi:CBS domain-containing protein